MYILIISRGIPSKKYPQWGCFEKDQAEALADLGHKVVVMSIDARLERSRGKFGLTRQKINGVIYYNKVVLPAEIFIKTVGRDNYWKHIKFKTYNSLLNKIIKKEGTPDIIYSQFFSNTAFAAFVKDKINIPVVGIEHLARFNNPSLSKFDEKWAAYAFKGCDKLIAVSGSLAKNIENRFGKECVVVHNMYGNEFDNLTSFPKWDPSQPLKFITVGSLIHRKGFDMLIKAFAKANLPSDKWELRIIGWGEEKENLENLIKECKLEKNIHLLGKMDKKDISEELSKSNVFVLPSRNENFSVAILEGLSMGLPVIATDCGGIRECLNNKNGIIVPVDDCVAMADAIKEIISNYTNFDRECIAEDSKNRFSPKAIASQLIEVFNSVVR